MNVVSNLRHWGRQVVVWQHFGTGVSALALGAVLMAAGFTGNMAHVAAADPTCDPNDVMACGASDASEFVSKIAGNLGQVYAHFGLSSGGYGDLKSKGVIGTAKQDGTIVDNHGDIVVTDAWSIGQTHFDYAVPYEPLSGTGQFFRSANTDVLQEDLPVLLLFDDEGAVKFAVIMRCGNPTAGEKVKSGAKCEDLIKEPVDGKKDTYTFTTKAHTFGNADFLKFEYYYDEGDGEKLFATTESLDEPAERKFEKSAKVRVKIIISVPGDQEQTIVSGDCVEEVKVEKEVPPAPPKEQPPVKVLNVKTVKQPAALPVTGPAGLAGLFTGVGIAGAAGHHLYVRYRSRKHQE